MTLMIGVMLVTLLSTLMEFDVKSMAVLNSAPRDVNNATILWKSLLGIFAQSSTAIECNKTNVLHANLDSRSPKMDLAKSKMLNA